MLHRPEPFWNSYALTLWTLVVSESGSGKSPVLNALLSPLTAALAEAGGPPSVEAEPTLWDRLNYDDVSAGTAEAGTAIRKRQAEMYPEHRPDPLVDDATPEAILLAMEHQEMRTLQFAAEGGFTSFMSPGQKGQPINLPKKSADKLDYVPSLDPSCTL